MQYPDTYRCLGYALPNGTYSVTVSVGDKPWVACADSKHTINVEGVFAINGFQETQCKVSTGNRPGQRYRWQA